MNSHNNSVIILPINYDIIISCCANIFDNVLEYSVLK